MQYLAAVAVSVLATTSVAPHAVPIQRSAEVATGGEAYVAELDGYWTVTRETRMPCDIDRGCAVDLALTRDGAPAGTVHVRFEPLRSGKVEVTSAIEDPAGHAVAQPAQTIGIDQTGFGAVHVEATPMKSAATAEGSPVILMAIKVPSWAAPLHPAAVDGDPV